jgi:hypothetical protein
MPKKAVMLVLLLIATIALTSHSDASSSQEACFYRSKAFAPDVTFQVHGATCQQCSTQAGGSWIDKDQGCEKKREKELSGLTPTTAMCTDHDGTSYSEGAILDDQNHCSRCQSGQWFDLDRNAYCRR